MLFVFLGLLAVTVWSTHIFFRVPEEIPALLAGITATLCLLIGLFIAPLQIQLLALVLILVMERLALRKQKA